MKRILILILIGLGTFSCKKDDEECCDATNPDCINYDPCLGQSEVTAAFVIEEKNPAAPDSLVYYNSESLIFQRRILRFRALDEEATSYTWYLGSEVVEAIAFERLFDETVPFRTEITVSLVIEKEANTDCFPMDDGVDSLSKTFTIVDYCDQPISQQFKGIFHEAPASAGGIDIPTDSTIVTITFFDQDSGECGAGFTTFNLGGIMEMFVSAYPYSASVSDRLFFYGAGVGTPANGYADYNQEEEVLNMRYRYFSSNYEFQGVPLE